MIWVFLWGTGDIIDQYVKFTEVSDEQIKIYGRTREAVTQTIRICKDQNILKNYLTTREAEVTDMLTTLYDQDEVLELFIASERREAAKEAAEKATEEAAKEFYANHVPIEIIAKSLKIDVKTVESWVF